MVRLLDEREAACRAEHDRLRVEIERVSGLLAACGVELERLVTARGVVAELTAKFPVGVVVPAQGGGLAGGGKVDGFADEVIAVLAGLRRPARCHEVVAGLGEDASVARNVERVRHRLKKLVAAGRVEQTTAGMFTLSGDRVARG
jgi:hypothetical protein